MTMDNEERALLEAFVVENEDLERLEALLAQFNIFEALGAVRQELRHSDFLAFLVDPAQNHGLGDAFLKRLLKRALVEAADSRLSAVEVDVADLHSATVRREWQNIDILIHDPENHLICAIENKIDSGEHSEQLQRYRKIVEGEFPNERVIFLFLTPEGDQPSDEAYIPISYALVADLVSAVRQNRESTLGPDVSTLMDHYATMLRRYIVSESEIAKLCRQIYGRHKQALDLIFEHRPDLQWELTEFIKQLVDEADTPRFVWDHTSKAYIRFALAEWDDVPVLKLGQGWTRSGRILMFEIQNTPDSIALRLLIGPGPDEVRKVIYHITEEFPQVFRGGSKRLYTKWTTVHVHRLVTRRDFEDADYENLTEKVRRSWDIFVKRDLRAIQEAISGIAWPDLPSSEGRSEQLSVVGEIGRDQGVWGVSNARTDVGGV